MRKKIYGLALTGILVLAQVVTVSANRPAHVALDGFLLNLDNPAVVLDGRTMINVEDLTYIFGDVVLSIESVEIDGRNMLPARELANAMSFVISWDDENSLVRLSSTNPDYSLLSQISRVQPTFSMTFQAAINRINNRDTRLLSMEENRIIIEREQREIDDYLRENRIHGVGRRNYTVPQVQMLRAREAVRNQLQSLKINERLIREGNELQLRNALAEIARTELDIALLERQLALEERNTMIVELMHSLGMESDAGARDARAALERTRTNLENLRSALSSNRVTLNTMLGLSASAIVEIQGLSWGVARSPLEGHVASQRANAPNIALLRLDLSFAEYVYHSYDVLLMSSEQESDYRYRGRPQDASIVIEMRNDISTAERALSNAQNSLENRIRSLHNDIAALLEQQAVSQNDLANAIEDYQETMLRYMTGMATWLELERAMLAILNHEIALARHEINLGVLSFMYQRPYLN